MSARAPAPPPRLALWLLRLRFSGVEQESLIGDLLEEFHDARVPMLGTTRARRWFWRESIVALVTVRSIDLPQLSPATGDPSVLSFLSDLRHGARLLRRSPGFTLLSVLTLGLGIGATTAIFSIANPVLLRPLPYPEPERIATVWERDRDGNATLTSFATFTDLARDSRTLERSALLSDWQITVSGAGEAERLDGARVSWTFFRVLGVRPVLGRDFAPEEDVPGSNHVVMLSHGLWTRRFGADSTLPGKTISLDGAPYVVAGILPATFDNVFSAHTQIWRVLGYGPAQPWACRTCRHVRMIARLRPGVTIDAARMELDRLSSALVKTYPHDYSAAGTRVVPLQEQVTQAIRPVLLAVLAAVALVLLIAIANVTNLQLARAMRREDEFAIRAALGAGRARLAKQLLAEGLLLAVMGGAAGVVVAWLALPALLARLPDSMPRLAAVRLDAGALTLAAAITLCLGVVVGLVPVWQGGRASLVAGLRGSGRVTGARRRVARAGLVVSEVALALMLLVGAGLLSRSLSRLMGVDTGFDATHLLTLEVQATGPRYREEASVFSNHERIIEAVRAVPGVVDAGLANQLPLGGNFDAYGVMAQDKPLTNPELAPSADRYAVTPDFMRTMRIPLIEGRGFVPEDNKNSAALVTIVSASLAAKMWPGEDALGKHLRVGGATRPWRQVIGVAGNVHHRGLDQSSTDQIYIPEQQWFDVDNVMTLVVRTRGVPSVIAPAVRRAVQDVDNSQPIMRVATMDQVISTSVAERRLALLLFAAFAAVAAMLAAAGIYGVLAGSVTERTREIGVRSALGASPGDILSLVLLQGARLAGAGLLVGIAGALGLGRFLESLLFGVTPADPLTLGGVALLLALVALVACLAPAMRALRVDPMTALRSD